MNAELLRRRGDTVTIAPTGTAAQAATRSNIYDLILCDLALGGDLDGYQVAHRLRRSRAQRTTPIIAVSGFNQDRDREHSRSVGFDAHLAKPLDLDHLDRLLHQWTRGWTTELRSPPADRERGT